MRGFGRRNLRIDDARRQVGRASAWVGVGLLALGCAPMAEEAPVEEPPLPPAESGSVEDPGPVPGAERPEVVEGVISLEGMQEEMTYRLYRSPEGFPIPFSTYVPEDMVAEEPSSGEGAAVRFVANFGGTRNEEIYLSAVFPSGDLSGEEARERVREVAESLGQAEVGTDPRYPWALEWYRFQAEGSVLGTVALGRHGGRYFYVVTHLPAEAGDGFGPRAARILDDWRWAEGGGLGT